MKSFKTLLKEFDLCLQKYNPIAYRTLPPPLPDDKIDFYLNELGISDEDFRLLYKWKDGLDFANGGDQYEIFSHGTLQGLRYSVEMGNDFWDETFVPLVSTNVGDWLL